MAAAVDILLNEDLAITNDGDIHIGFSDNQHIEHIMRAAPGHFMQHPTLGADITNKLNGSIDRAAIKKTIKKNLTADNMRLDELKVTNEFEIFITAIRLK